MNRSCDLLGNKRTLTKVQKWLQICDGDPPERLVLKRGRKQARCVGPCSSRIWAMAGRCGQRNRELKWNALAPLTRVWYFLFLFMKPNSSWKPFSALTVIQLVSCGAVASTIGGPSASSEIPPSMPGILTADCSPSFPNLVPVCC